MCFCTTPHHALWFQKVLVYICICVVIIWCHGDVTTSCPGFLAAPPPFLVAMVPWWKWKDRKGQWRPLSEEAVRELEDKYAGNYDKAVVQYRGARWARILYSYYSLNMRKLLTVKSAYKESTYKEIPVIRNWFFLFPYLYQGTACSSL